MQKLPRQKKNKHSTEIASSETIAKICENWGIDESKFTWWHRGRRVNLSNKIAYDRLYKPTVINKKGDFWPGESFHPLRVIHVGQPSFTDNKGFWRTRQEALELLRPHITKGLVDIDEETMISMLKGRAPLCEDFPADVEKGSAILKCGEYLLPVWIAARVSLMIDQKEQDVLRLKLNIEEEEEE